MGRIVDNPKSLSTDQLLKFADRSDPVVKVLCARLEVYINAYNKLQDEFKKAENYLDKM